MINIVVDTNILLRYILNDDEQQSLIAQRYLNNKQYHCILPTQVFCELDWVLRKTVKIHRGKVIACFEMLMSRSNIEVNNNELNMGLYFLKNGGDFADGVIAYQTRNYQNANFLSFDKQARKIAYQCKIELENME